MPRLIFLVCAVALSACGGTATPPRTLRPDSTITAAHLGPVRLVRPVGDATRVVLMPADTLDTATQAAAEALARRGALVGIVGARPLAGCAAPSTALFNLARFVQGAGGVGGYRVPVLAGRGPRGAAVVRAALAESPGVFAGGVVQDAGPTPTLCPSRPPTHAPRGAPTAIPDAPDWLAAAVDGLEPAGDAADWRIELPAAPHAGGPSRTLAIVISGDGGWLGLGGTVGKRLQAAGVPTVGWDALRYFWTPRTPEGAARDLAETIRTYSERWGTTRVALVGYSMGADVLPAMARSLPPDVRARVAGLVLLAPGRTAQFEFHVTNWVGGGADAGRPIAPDVAALAPIPVLCVYGQQETASLCPTLPAGAATVVAVSGGHHFDGSVPAVITRAVAAVLATNRP